MATKKNDGAGSTEAKATYEVVAKLRHDGEDYEAGDTVDLTENQAKLLLGHTVNPEKADPA